MGTNTASATKLHPFEDAVASNSDRSISIPSEVLGRAYSQGMFELAESYAKGRWDLAEIDVLLTKIFTGIANSGQHAGPKSAWHWLRLARHVLRELLGNPQGGPGAFIVGAEHYDLGNDLFESMLDRTLSYTCGCWNNSSSLEAAQIAKLDLLCRKLNLKPGMTVLDIGCGWGNFAEHAAKNYGVSVVGYTISKEQAKTASQRCANLPVTIMLDDYRNIAGTYDRIISIEMIEAVGRKNLPVFFGVANRALKPNGLFALEVISGETVSRHSIRALDEYFMWIERFIFPNGYLPRLDELAEPARSEFVIEDLQNFGPDYDLTLMAWAKNFDAAWPKLKPRYSETFRRRWRYYLLSCAALFRSRTIQLYQIVYAKSGRPGRYERL